MAKRKHIDHANHNHDVCDYLNGNKTFPDWTIISAFYSALHFVSHKIFPMKGKTDEGHKYVIETVEEYINIKLRNQSAGKHFVLVDLVYSKCNSSIGSKYRKLLELSKTARYTDYNLDQKMADAAIKALNDIEGFCKS